MPDSNNQSAERAGTESESTDGPTSEKRRGLGGWSRRKMLTVAGAGVGIGAFAQTEFAGASQEGDDGEEAETETETETGTEAQTPTDTVYDDLIDPVFGYPLSVGETEEADVEAVVEMVIEEGEGAHEDFPQGTPAEFFFDPVGVLLTPGTVVKFPSVAGLHTVTAYHEKYSEPPAFTTPTRIPDGVEGFSSPPLTAGESWLYDFPTSGVYDVLCLPHFGLGMVMRAVVMDPETDEVPAAPTSGYISPGDEAVLTAPELEPSNIVDAGTVAWADLTIEVPEGQTETPTGTGMATETETESG